MFTINVENECGCFKRSDYDNNMKFENKDDALVQAIQMQNHMNQNFCQKHEFTLNEDGQNFNIGVSMKPRQASSGGCCGGGHCG
jgi:hypothetical protein